jgi:hypothetical protein
MLARTSRIVGIDDSPFRSRGPHARVLLVGVLMRGHEQVDGVMSARVVRDGLGATRVIASMLTSGRLAGQAQVVLLDGIAVGGFNVIDLPALSEAVRAPVVAVMRRMPDLQAVRRALSRTTSPERRWRVIERAGPIHQAGKLHFQVAGADPAQVPQMLAVACGEGGYPEALRLAHIIGGGVVLGSSRGRA